LCFLIYYELLLQAIVRAQLKYSRTNSYVLIYENEIDKLFCGKQNYENKILTDLNNKVIRILVATDSYSRLIGKI